MAESLRSPLWYRVAPFRPKLHTHVRVERQIYRNQTWYLLRDSSSGRHHRVNELAYQFVGRLDGRMSVDQIWHLLAEELGERSLTQHEIVQTLIQLAELDIIQVDKNPEFADLFRRREERARRRWTNNVNPLAFKVRLFDPSHILARLAQGVQFLFSRAFLLAWFALVSLALLSVRSNWDVIAAHAATEMLTPRFLVMTWLCFPLIKLVHEFAHALAVKVQGGTVHELGVRVLFLTPVPYVDASAANAFRSKWQRIRVSLAGIMAELFLAAIAALVWISIENGVIREIAFVTMTIGGVSTVLFNGNPLLRFDGYYALSDLLDLPNLAQRSNAYWAYLAQRHLCRLQSTPCPAATLSERAWFLAYGLGALVYRWLVSIWIALWVSAKSLPLAAVLGCWFLFTLLAKPIASAARFLATAPQLARERARAIGISVAALASIVILVFWVPVPSWTLAQGVVWLPDDARIRTGTEGFVKEVLVRDGETVRVGQPLIVLEAPDLVARQAELTAQLERLEAQYQHSLGSSPGEASAAEQARDQAQAELTRINQRLGELRIDSPVEGTLAMPYQEDLRESFVQRGAVLAHVMTNASLQVRVAVPHSDAALIRDRHEHIEVRLAEQPANPANAHLLREVPAATNILPAAALSDRFGGSITTDPQDPEAVHTLEPFFLFDITVPSERFQRAGARAWVRIDHGREPLAAQWGRSLRRMMLRHFSVQS